MPREAVRALVVDAEERVLLLRFENPVTGDVWWATPGGGVEGGRERRGGAPARAARGDAGSPASSPGRSCGRASTSSSGSVSCCGSAERFHLVRVDRVDVAPTIDLVPEGVHGHRWWTLDELDDTGERLAPRALRDELRRLLRDGPPPGPLDVSV